MATQDPNGKARVADLVRQARPVAEKPDRPGRADESNDTNMPLPKATEAMFPGLVGAVANAASEKTEVNPVAAAAGFLSFLGAMVGRDVYFPIGDTRHHARIFTLHIGRSSRGGKGESPNLTRRIVHAINAEDPNLLGQTHTGGLSSREGLAMLIHDGYTQGKETAPPILDKRLWVVEGEFANVLGQARREGNTLSSALREVWDGGAIKPATKTNRVWASMPHVGMAGAITPAELHATIQAKELSNGFANRFLMFWAERTREVAFPEPTSPHMLAILAKETINVVRFALGNYPAETDTRAMHMSQEARALWQDVHSGLARPLETELLSSLLERRRPYAIRLSMLFALCDSSLVIEAQHIRAALAWIDYCTDSVRYVFANQAQEARAMERERMAGMVLEFLQARAEGATLEAIRSECFNRKATPIPIVDVLSSLVADPRQGVELHLLPRSDGRAGRQGKMYRLAEKHGAVSAVSAVRGAARLPEDFEAARLGAVSFFQDEKADSQDLTAPNRDNGKSAETRAVAGKKLTALTAPEIFANYPRREPEHGSKEDGHATEAAISMNL